MLDIVRQRPTNSVVPNRTLPRKQDPTQIQIQIQIQMALHPFLTVMKMLPCVSALATVAQSPLNYA